MRLLLIFFILGTTLSYGQFVAKMEVKEPIDGLCNDKEVYALLPMLKGQEEAVCPVTKEQILERLNNEVQFIKDNPKYSDKGMIGIIINCKGQVVQCKMDNKTKSADLDKQIELVFNSLGQWTAGKLDSKEVDTSKLFSFKIKKGQFYFD
ncbi:MAG TPA: hypothetical protein PLJ08_19135 [Cyclobacteriaceae bacterium]|nr:hypothetical protein [Cyclobacteriaceae bacterium]